MERGGMLSKRDLLALVENAKALSSEIDLSDLLVVILQRAAGLTDSPSGSVMLHDDERKGIYFAAATGPKAQGVLDKFGETGPERIPIWTTSDPPEYASVAGKVYDTGKSEKVDQVREDPEHFRLVDQETKHRTESMICVPLAIGAERIGVMQLLNKTSGNYSSRDMMLLEHFAAHAAVAIRNARHIRDLLAHKGLFTSGVSGGKTTDLLRQLTAPAHKERMTVMFADMRGFTRLSQTLGDPSDIEQHLNEFLTLLAGEVVRQEGLVNKFLGDGVLALFRGPNAEVRAIRSAFGIVDGFAEVRDRWNRKRNEDVTFVDVGVGIVTGEVIIGAVGSGRVKDYTALGNYVNLAAAFEQDARGGQHVLVDQNTYNAVREIVAHSDDPTSFELRKADQPSGTVFKRHHIRRLRPEVGEPKVMVKDHVSGRMAARTDLRKYYKDSWAIVVGVNKYKSPHVPQLSYAVADAEAVAAALPAAGFRPDHIQILQNEKASREAIQQAIYSKVASTHEDDRLLIFFALHGEVFKQRKGEEGYLLPYDVDRANLPLTALPMTELAQIGRRLPPKHIMFVLDTCFSGYAAKRNVPVVDTASDLTALTNERVVGLLTAGTGDQKSMEEGGHGIFTRGFLKGLEGAADRDGTGLTAPKLAVYIQERVLVESGNRQTPQYAKLDGEGEFLFLPPQK